MSRTGYIICCIAIILFSAIINYASIGSTSGSSGYSGGYYGTGGGFSGGGFSGGHK